jgi:hypothetical protein
MQSLSIIQHALPQVDEVKNIMVENIEKVLERGEKIELLVDKTDNLRFQVRLAPPLYSRQDGEEGTGVTGGP